MGVYAYLSIFDVVLKLILVIILQYINYDKLIFGQQEDYLQQCYISF